MVAPTSFVEFTGAAKLDRRTKNLVHRLGPDDVAIIDHADLDRVSAEELLESGVRVGSVFRNGDVLAAGRALGADELARAVAEQRGRVTEALEEFADNTLRYLREEGRLLSEGIDFPSMETRFRDRHALVVARGPGHKRDLRIVKPYIRDFKPVLVAVDGGADALLEAGYTPDVIVGDMDSVSDRALQSGAELLVHAYRNGNAPGAERARVLGVPHEVVSMMGISEDL